MCEGPKKKSTWKSRLENIKLVVETVLFFSALVGLCVSALYIKRTWPYPSGELSTTLVPAQDNSLILDISFKVGDHANLDVEKMTVECFALDPTHGTHTRTNSCPEMCKETIRDITKGIRNGRGILTTGSTHHYSCLLPINTQQKCLLVSVDIESTTESMMTTPSYWRSQSIHCPK